MLNLLFSKSVPVANKIRFNIRNLGEILEFGENEYFAAISTFLADPFDYMLPLYEAGIDYEQIDEFQLFLSLLGQLTPETMQFLFGDTLTFENKVLAQDNQNNEEIVLVNPEDPEDVFNASTLMAVADVIRQVHFMEHQVRKAGNAAAKQYFLELAMKRAKRKKKEEKPALTPLIVSLVNAPEFPYNYETCKEVSIYQFLSSVRKIPKRLSWNFVMHGVHVGMIDGKSLNWQELDWMS